MENKNLEVLFCNKIFRNPIIVCSGTFGFGYEMKSFFDIEKLGGITTKTITLFPRKGNELPRIIETSGGLLNSIGLQNPGLDIFIKNILPEWGKIRNVNLIVSVGGDDIFEYIEICEKLNNFSRIDFFELNISCPNVKKGCLSIGQNLDLLKKLLNEIKSFSKKPIIIKVSPNFNNLIDIVNNIIDFGGDAVSLFNTFLGTRINIKTRKYFFKNKVAGFSGPAIKPLALKLLIDIKNNIKKDIPIIGMGGITDFNDALEFLIAGANIVSIGAMNLVNPLVSQNIIDDLDKFCIDNNIKNISNLIGSLYE